MNALELAAIGWVGDEPTGNRLRWAWPEEAADGNRHILPDRILVERAPLDIDIDMAAVSRYGWSAGAPADAWVSHGDVPLDGPTPVQYAIGGSVQAVQFRYMGTSAVVQAFDGDDCVATRSVVDQDLVVLQAAAMDLLTITAPHCELRQLATLDLYAPPQPWFQAIEDTFEVVADIELAATGGAAFADAATRYPAMPTLDASRWGELLGLWDRAWAEKPGAKGPEGHPNYWQELQVVLGARWEHAVCCGLGAVDGPASGSSVLDSYDGEVLSEPAGVAYRVRDADERLDPSNVVFIPGQGAPDLDIMPAPNIEGAIRLGASGKIRASWEVTWQSPNPWILGVQVEEQVRVGGDPYIDGTFDGRGRKDEDEPGAGFIYREEEVASHQVEVVAKVRAQDGFDRLGPRGPATSQTLPINHHPQPPPLRSAANDGPMTILAQSPPSDWAPDALVAAAAGKVRIMRRIADPVRFSTSVVEVIPSGDGMAVTFDQSAPASPTAFIGGQIQVGALRATIAELSWPYALVSLPSDSGPVAAVEPNSPAELSQSPTHPSLFVKVHEVPAGEAFDKVPALEPLPASQPGEPAEEFSTITFVEPFLFLVSSTTAQVLEYRAQVAFAGQTGPLGPAIQALRLPPTPKVPPPFKVKTLGVDFYDRTVVQLDLTTQSDELLEVWWAEGKILESDFHLKAVQGDAGARPAEGGKTLFDTLSLPVPREVDRTVTIGVQAVNGADGRGGFRTVTHTLPAP